MERTDPTLVFFVQWTEEKRGFFTTEGERDHRGRGSKCKSDPSLFLCALCVLCGKKSPLFFCFYAKNTKVEPIPLHGVDQTYLNSYKKSKIFSQIFRACLQARIVELRRPE